MPSSVLITGANSGIGLVTTLELAASGWDVIATTRTAEKAAAVHDAAAERGVDLRTVLCDVDDPASCAAAVAEAEALSGGLHALVNNAGYVQAGAVEDLSDEQVRAQLETNVVAPIRLARLVLPGMRERGDGRIVNVSSVAGRLTTPLMGWYAASKHALEAVTDALRMEVEGDGIKVALVEPGMFDTHIWSAADAGYPEPDDPSLRRRLRARAGAQRTLAPPARPGVGGADDPVGAVQPGAARPLRRGRRRRGRHPRRAAAADRGHRLRQGDHGRAPLARAPALPAVTQR